MSARAARRLIIKPNENSSTDRVQGEISLEVLLISIYYLMTRYAIKADARVAEAIAQHFEMLASHQDCDTHIMKRAGERLSSQWRNVLVGELDKAGFVACDKHCVTGLKKRRLH